MLAALIAAKFVLLAGVFYGLGLILQMGAPLDALRAAFHRTWLGAAGTMVCVVAYILARLWGSSPEAIRLIGLALLWGLRLAAAAWVLTTVYRVTRWRKGKLAIAMGVLLAVDFGVDYVVGRIQESRPFMPALGEFVLQLC